MNEQAQLSQDAPLTEGDPVAGVAQHIAPQERVEDKPDSFYPNSGAAIEVPPADRPEDEDMQAIRSEWTMYPAEVNQMVPHDVLDSVIGQTVEMDDGQQAQVTREMARKAVSELRAFVGDLGLTREEVTVIRQSMNQLAAPGSAFDPVQNRERAVELLNSEHKENAAQAFRASRAYVAKNPKLGRLLDRTGLGDDPATVAAIARRAMNLVRAGKLRIK